MGKETNGPATEHHENSMSSAKLETTSLTDPTEGLAAFQEAHALDSIEDTRPGNFVWLCVTATAIGGALFGYDTGVISGVLVVLGDSLDNRALSAADKELITTLCALGSFFGAIVAGTTADKFGRKQVIWFASVLFTVGAVVQATSYSLAQLSAFKWIPLDLHTLELTTDTVNWAAYLVLVMMILFVAFYAIGLGCVPWQANDLLPMEVRALGTMFMNMFIWWPNIVVSSTFLSMMQGITPSGAFGFYAVLCFIGWCFVFFLYPEASNMHLEEVRAIFQHGYGVQYANEWHKQRKAALKEAR